MQEKKKLISIQLNENQIEARATLGPAPTPSRKKNGGPHDKAKVEAERLLTSHQSFY